MKYKKKIAHMVSNVSILRKNSGNQINTRLAWIYFHDIAAMYMDLKHKETFKASLSIQKLKLPFFLQCPSEINLNNWIYQETYKKCH